MNEHDFEWFLQNQTAYDSLTTEQLHVLGQGGMVAYDPDGVAEPAAVEPAAVEPAAVEPAAVEPAAVEPEPQVLAKDGKNFIPYSELETARERAAQLETIAKEQSALIESLKAAKVADAGTGDTAAQDDLLKEFADQYPDMAPILAPVIQKMIDAGVNAKTADLEKRFTDALAPIQQTNADTETDKHFKAIIDKVPDFEALLESGQVEKWVGTLPSYVKVAANKVLSEGTASEVVELFESYKAATKAPSPSITKDEAAAKAAEAVSKAKGAKPVSLTDVPGAGQQAANEEPTTVAGWSAKFANMSPEAIMKSL